MKTDNELIAEFMGYEQNKNDPHLYREPIPNFINLVDVRDMRYEESWDWLMPVVEKIWDLDINTLDLGADFTESNPKTNIFRLPLMVPIDMAYEAVVEFIKWYNTQPK